MLLFSTNINSTAGPEPHYTARRSRRSNMYTDEGHGFNASMTNLDTLFSSSDLIGDDDLFVAPELHQLPIVWPAISNSEDFFSFELPEPLGRETLNRTVPECLDILTTQRVLSGNDAALQWPVKRDFLGSPFQDLYGSSCMTLKEERSRTYLREAELFNELLAQKPESAQDSMTAAWPATYPVLIPAQIFELTESVRSRDQLHVKNDSQCYQNSFDGVHEIAKGQDLDVTEMKLTEEKVRFEPMAFHQCRISDEDRKDKLLRYRLKKGKRKFGRQIKYEFRKNLADKQPRIRGRFSKSLD